MLPRTINGRQIYKFVHPNQSDENSKKKKKNSNIWYKSINHFIEKLRELYKIQTYNKISTIKLTIIIMSMNKYTNFFL